MKGKEETSTSMVRRRKGSNWESPTTSSLVSSMSMEELRSLCRVLEDISLELLDGLAHFIVRKVNNVVYFTREQFAIGLRFLVSSLVKQFLNVTQAPLVLVHSNVFSDFNGLYNMLNFLYQLEILLAEICFVYTLKLGTGGQLSMSAHSPWLQFVTGLHDSPKTEAKGVILVKGPWYEMPSSLSLPFDVNQSLTFPG